MLSVVEAVPQPFTYTGRERDAESGLYHYRSRYYDQNTGRFLSEDPIRFNGTDQNLYRYVFNDPLNLVDPDGEFALVLFVPFLGGGAGTGAAGAALGGAAAGAATAAAAAALNLLTPSESGAGSDVVPQSFDFAEHTKNKRRSTKDKHERAQGKISPKKADKRRKSPAKDKKKNKQCK